MYLTKRKGIRMNSSSHTSGTMAHEQPTLYRTLNPDQIGLPDQVRTLLEENRQLRDQIASLQAHIAKLEKTEREVMTLVKAPARERIVHDLRNVLNELVLLQAIAAQDDL
jgi:hypothetical protein